MTYRSWLCFGLLVLGAGIMCAPNAPWAQPVPNLKSAKTLELQIPQSLLLRTDQVIQ